MQMLAEEKGCILLSTELSTYVAGQVLSQAAPIRYYMTQSNLLTQQQPGGGGVHLHTVLPVHLIDDGAGAAHGDVAAESLLAALEMDAGCIVVCASSKVSRTMQMLAEEKWPQCGGGR